METLLGIQWQHMFVPTVALVELILRGTVIYLGIFALMRFVLKREGGALGLPDLLMIVLIADAAQNAMAAQYQSLPEGLLLIGTIVFWNYTLDWLGQRCPAVERLLHQPPVPLGKAGRLLRRNMRRKLITEEEVMSQVRQHGITDLAHVQAVYIEGDGHISVIPRETQAQESQANKRAAL